MRPHASFIHVGYVSQSILFTFTHSEVLDLALHRPHALYLFLRVLQFHRQPLPPPLEPLEPPRLELVAADETGAEDEGEQEHPPVES